MNIQPTTIEAAFELLIRTVASDEFQALAHDAEGRQARRDLIRVAARPFYNFLYAQDKTQSDRMFLMAYSALDTLQGAISRLSGTHHYSVADWFTRVDPALNGESRSWGHIA